MCRGLYRLKQGFHKKAAVIYGSFLLFCFYEKISRIRDFVHVSSAAKSMFFI